MWSAVLSSRSAVPPPWCERRLPRVAALGLLRVDPEGPNLVAEQQPPPVASEFWGRGGDVVTAPNASRTDHLCCGARQEVSSPRVHPDQSTHPPRKLS